MEINRLVVKPGELLLLRGSFDDLSAESRETLRDQIPDGVNAIFIDESVEVTVVASDEVSA
jgi:flagellar basal body-associated protein FliL